MRQWLLILLSILILGGLWLALKPATAGKGPQLRVYSLTIIDGSYSGADKLIAYQGDSLRFEVLSNHDDAMHVHGYEKHLELPAGQRAVLEFSAQTSGRFALELHGNELQLGSLEVYPRP